MNSLLFKPHTYIVIIKELIKLKFELGFNCRRGRYDYRLYRGFNYSVVCGVVYRVIYRVVFAIYIIVSYELYICKVNTYPRLLSHLVPFELAHAQQAD
jgi:hypothetical protein